MHNYYFFCSTFVWVIIVKIVLNVNNVRIAKIVKIALSVNGVRIANILIKCRTCKNCSTLNYCEEYK